MPKPTPLGARIVAGLSEFLANLRAGVPIECTEIRVNPETGEIERRHIALTLDETRRNNDQPRFTNEVE